MPFFLLLVPACGSGSGTATPPPVVGPSAAPTPNPTPTPNPYAAACGQPLPSLQDAYGFKVKVQFEVTKTKKILNASPQVANADYCRAAGLPGSICNTRNENDPTRVPCDYYLSGIAETGQPGPNWYEVLNGERILCGGPGQTGPAPDCSVNDANQYLLDVKAAGTYEACGGKGSTGTCGSCTLSADEFNKLHRNPAGLCGG